MIKLNLLKQINWYYQVFKLKKIHVRIGRNVRFNNAKFEKYTWIHNNSNVENSIIGENSYIGWNSVLKNCNIGSYCSIGPFTKVIYGAHPLHMVSTSPVFFSNKKQTGMTFVSENKFEEYVFADNVNKYSVVIGSDVWIGYDVRILQGVTIGHGAIIGTGSLVTKDVEAYSIVSGVPASLKKYRFDKNQITKLLNIKWWNKGINWIRKYSLIFDDIDLFLNNIKE